jgi:phage anti-repressor protein
MTTEMPDIDNCLKELLIGELDGEEQKRFIDNFQMYLTHGHDNSKYVIDLDKVIDWIGFVAKGTAKRHLKKFFRENVDYVVNNLLDPEVKQLHGGHNKEKILMNVDTFKAICMTANTERGKQTRTYYAKMERLYFMYIEKRNRAIIDDIKCESTKKLQLARHNQLRHSHKDTPCVYVVKVIRMTKDGEILVNIYKIGETDDINQRMSTLRQTYTDFFLVDVFPCNRPHKFEQYLLNRPDIKKRRIPNSELIQLTSDYPYEQMKKDIEKNIGHFNIDSAAQRLECKKLNYLEKLHQERTLVLQRLASSTDASEISMLTKVLTSLLDKAILNPCVDEAEAEDEQTSTQPDVPPIDSERRIYQYDPDNLSQPVNMFYNMRDAARSLNDPKMHDYHIRLACENNTLVKSHRWFCTEGTCALPQTIPETKIETIQLPKKRLGLVAQINKEKNKILKVYSTQKEAAEILKTRACNITIALSKQSMATGFYWKMYNDCDDTLKSTYEGDMPLAKPPMTSSRYVERIDPVTHTVLERYDCIQDVCSQFKTCHKTIHKMSESGDIYRGFKWKVI